MKLFKIIFFLLGLTLLGWVVQNTNLPKTLDLVSQIGFGFLLILGVYFLAFLFDSLTWQMTLLAIPLTPKWLYHFFQMRLAGEAFNNVLPAASMGGEPIKAVLLKNLYDINYRDGVASLILARTINTAALILFLIVGFVLMLESAVFDEKYNSIAGVGLAVLSLLIFLFFAVQRFKLASLTSEVLAKKNGFRWLDGILHHIKDIDETLVKFYTAYQGRAAGAFALAFMNWVLGVGEIMITMHLLGHPVSLTDAWIIEAVAQLVRAATFFIPASIGAQEGAFLVIGSAVTGSPTLGVAMAIVRRAREIIWITWGMLAFYIIKPDTDKNLGRD
jgi:glycosyltransferase 2 family protein